MLLKIQPALSDYYSDNAEPLATRIFSSIWDTFENVAKPRILDLGEAQTDSFNFYSEHSCYLTIADCIQTLIQLNWPNEENPNALLTQKIEKIIPYTNKKYDLILGWDSFNYIPPKILPFVHNHLLQFCTKKTIIHGFIFTSENRPKETGRFKIFKANEIKHTVRSDEVARHTPLTPYTINKAMPNFKYARSVLMRSGLQEFMLTTK